MSRVARSGLLVTGRSASGPPTALGNVAFPPHPLVRSSSSPFGAFWFQRVRPRSERGVPRRVAWWMVGAICRNARACARIALAIWVSC
jgi:hypothetical protein